jgi:hypothetical protein
VHQAGVVLLTTRGSCTCQGSARAEWIALRWCPSSFTRSPSGGGGTREAASLRSVPVADPVTRVRHSQGSFPD